MLGLWKRMRCGSGVMGKLWRVLWWRIWGVEMFGEEIECVVRFGLECVVDGWMEIVMNLRGGLEWWMGLLNCVRRW